MNPSLRVFADADELCKAARAEFLRRAHDAIARHERFTVALAGGSTPEKLYRSLVDAELDWEKVLVFFGDERCVPPDHGDSNYRMASTALLSHIKLPSRNVHRFYAELDPVLAAAEYAEELRRIFALAPGQWPAFDLILLGVGVDGHTASLFPGSSALAERATWVAATRVAKLDAWRLTLTLPVLVNAECVMFLAAGADKREAVRTSTQPEIDEHTPPAGLVRPTRGELLWFVDRAAAGA